MLDLRKLFLPQKDAVKNRVGLPKLLVFVFLNLPIQTLFAEGPPSTPMPIDNPAVGMPADKMANLAPGVSRELMSIINSKQHPFMQLKDFQYRAEDLDALYKSAGYQLLWLGNPQAEKNTADVLKVLEEAGLNGLETSRYDVVMLKQKIPAALLLMPDNYQQLALHDTAISIALLRFLHDLHYGRVNPKDVNFNLKLRELKQIDLPALIKSSQEHATVLQLPAMAEPKLKQYQLLKQALAKYRSLANDSKPLALAVNKPINPGGNLSPGQADELSRYLEAVGDMPIALGGEPKKSNHYSGELLDGVKKFQLRHGMNADGVLGKGTVAAINVPFSVRATQIELAMERLRWLPEPSAGASIIVNIPAFQLWAYDDVDEFNSDMPTMRVVVGKALKNQTPILMAKMSFIDFMPYWNVPYNIVKDEILPKLVKNRGYLASQNMELVSTFGNETKAVGFSSGTIAQLKQGSLRVRQRPGKKNALGKVKFIFPNKSDVYLHDTPSRSLFSRSRRDFSHGCVRVANPDRLAEFALKNQWSKEAIHEALATQKTRRVVLKKSIPVTFFYMTSFIDHHDNLSFYSDVYDYDAILQAALAKPGDVSDHDIFVQAPELEPVEAIKPIDFMVPIQPVASNQE
ncbi:MAG: L,D-transpeptidase family protein [Methylococcales bacterium]|nr:L,D-transpeptidase family protein [Methylococcales bacterium]